MTTAPAADKPAIPTIEDFTVLAGIGELTTTPVGEQTTPQPDDRRTRRMQASRAEKRTDREHNLALRARERKTRLEEKATSKEQRRLERAAARQDRKALRAERRTLHAERDARIKHHATTIGRRFLVIGPITAPMAVAWSSQTSYAMTAFHWPMIFALGFAAAWELSTTFTGWMYHQARKTGDRGLEYRILTWIFALGAAGMNYAHHCGPNGKPTQAAVAFSAMSITGMILWESYARLVHRQHLRAQGLVPHARPRLGAVRWIRYPVHAWTAWSLTIRSADLDTADKAWTAADRILTDRKTRRTIERVDRSAVRSGLAVHRLVVPRVRTADRGPSSIPAVHITVDRADRTRTGPPVQRSAKTVHAVDRTAGDRTGPAIASGPDRTAAQGNTGRTADRTATTDHNSGPDRRQDAMDRTASSGPDRTGMDLDLTPLERDAISSLRTADRSISKRSIQDVVRNELGGSIASDRAVQIARHFRTLRSAA